VIHGRAGLGAREKLGLADVISNPRGARNSMNDDQTLAILKDLGIHVNGGFAKHRDGHYSARVPLSP